LRIGVRDLVWNEAAITEKHRGQSYCSNTSLSLTFNMCGYHVAKHEIQFWPREKSIQKWMATLEPQN
jgi:hypothetical protein